MGKSPKESKANQATAARKKYPLSEIPTDLTFICTPPDVTPPPPVTGKLQELPFQNLSWENFQRLCYRLAQQDKKVEYVEIYGTQGSAQEGIDLYARSHGAEKFAVFQCKNEKEFGPKKITDAVQEFLGGEWVSRTEEFYLFCKENLTATPARSTAIEESRTKLKEHGIKLVNWSGYTLVTKLKTLPDIVEDFFGPDWAKAFCTNYSERNDRLSALRYEELRQRLFDCYRMKFTADESLLLNPVADSSILNRFVEPAIKPASTQHWRIARTEHAVRPSVDTERSGTTSDEATQGETNRTPLPPVTNEPKLLGEWLLDGHAFSILGDAGMGKTSLLRFLAMDLLASKPRLSSLASKWGHFLPLWLPFSFWAASCHTGSVPNRTFEELIQDWLRGLDSGDLWPLLERGLRDKRIILLIDGLDEWHREETAQAALQKLLFYASKRNLPAILTSRPAAFHSVSLSQGAWKVGALAPLSKDQAEEFLRRNVSDFAPSANVSQQEQFVGETLEAVYRSAEFAKLAETPLLLGFLLYFKVHNLPWPSDRHKAFQVIIDHLLEHHPRERQKSSLTELPSAPLSKGDIRSCLQRLAYALHNKKEGGVLPLLDCKTELSTLLAEQGRDPEVVLKYLTQTIGILGNSGDGYYFVHKAFQDFLAAEHLVLTIPSHLPDLLRTHAGTAAWHDLFLAAFYLAPTEPFKEAILNLGDLKFDKDEHRHNAEILSCRFLAGTFSFSENQSQQLFESVVTTIEGDGWDPQQERLIDTLLPVLQREPVPQFVIKKMQRWFPRRLEWTYQLFDAMEHWQPSEVLFHTVRSNLRSLYEAEVRTACSLLGRIALKIPTLLPELYSLCDSSPSPYIRAAALETLTAIHPTAPATLLRVTASENSECPEIFLAARLARIQNKGTFERDLDAILPLAAGNGSLHYDWKKLLASVLTTHFRNEERLKSACIDVLSDRYFRIGRQRIEPTLAWEIVIKCFPSDPTVQQLVTTEIETGERPFISMDNAWKLVQQQFPACQEIADAADRWIQKQDFHDWEVASAALISRSEIARSKLLTMLSDSWAPHWGARALLEGWSDDTEVREKLVELALGSSQRASKIGFLLPQIIEDQAKCKQRLLELLADEKCDRFDFVLSGIAHFNDPDLNREAVTIGLEVDPNLRGMRSDEHLRFDLIRHFPFDKRVRDLALKEFDRQDGQIVAIARAYPTDREMHDRILACLNFLPDNLRYRLVAGFPRKQLQRTDVARMLFRNYDFECEVRVKTSAAVNFFAAARHDVDAVDHQVQVLAKDILVTGPDYEERRQAAFCGLLALRKLEVFRDAQKGTKPEEALKLSLSAKSESNWPIIGLILTNWNYVVEVLGPDLWLRLGRSEKEVDLYSEIAPIAHYYKEPTQHILDYLGRNKPEVIDSQLLYFIARTRPKSPLLHDYCMASIFEGRSPRYNNPGVSAAVILGEHFHGDSHTQRRLEERWSFDYRNAIVTALCIGWPQSSLLTAIWARRSQSEFQNLAPVMQDQVCILKLDPEDLVTYLGHRLSDLRQTRNTFGSVPLRLLTGRMRTDKELLALFTEKTVEGEDPNWLLTFAKLLFARIEDSEKLAKACRAAIEAQPNALGYDALKGDYVPLRIGLLDSGYEAENDEDQ